MVKGSSICQKKKKEEKGGKGRVSFGSGSKYSSQHILKRKQGEGILSAYYRRRALLSHTA